MKGRLLIPLLIFFLLSCKGKNKIPSGVLPQKKMQAVLWDVMRADQFLSDYVLNKDSSIDKVKESLKYYEEIFTLHKITKEQFQKSFSFYKEHPILLKAIMDSMSHAPTVAPTQVVAPTPVVQPVSVSDSDLPLQQRPKRDSLRALQKKKGLSPQ